jgi:peroxiredoxin
MKQAIRLITLAIPLLFAETQASPAEANRIMQSWDRAVEIWNLEMRAAATPQANAAVLAKRPDRMAEARRMWQLIGNELDQEWIIEPSAWFLRITQGLVEQRPDGANAPAFVDETKQILQTIETHHLKSPKLITMCMALAASSNPRALPLLEKIQTSNPDPKVQGVAAMANALVLKSLGEDPQVMRKRLTCLRKAIIDSSDVDLGGGVTVAKLAEDELYIIRHLTKGRVAPDLVGTDSANRPLKLSDEAGRIVMLLFWNSSMNEADRVIAMTNTALQRFKDRPVTVLGVNLDPLEKLRALEGDQTVTWRNISDPTGKLAQAYRVNSLPLVYVLDGERRIHFSGTPGSFAELTMEALLSELKPAGEE